MTSHDDASDNNSGVVIRTPGEPVGSRCLVVFPHFATLILTVGESVPVLTLQTAFSQDDQDLVIHPPETPSTVSLQLEIMITD